MISPLLLLGLLATSAQPAAAGELLRLEADRVVVDERMASGEGAVRAWLLDGELQAERFEILLDGGGAVLEEGSWSRPGATLQFQRLELLPDGRRVIQRRISYWPNFVGSPFYDSPANIIVADLPGPDTTGESTSASGAP